MELTFAPRDILQINDARIIYRNLRGEGSKFNREGDRNFAVVIPNQELADELMSFTDFSNRMLNGFSTDYAAYEVTKKYQKFVMKQFFK